MFLAPIFAFLGFFAAIEIHFAKQKKTKLACPRTSKCDMVIHSTYSKIGFIRNDVLGIVFYAAVLVLSLLVTFAPVVFLILKILTLLGLLFSLYLIFVQFFILRMWCAWCMLSSLSSIGLFICIHFIS